MMMIMMVVGHQGNFIHSLESSLDWTLFRLVNSIQAFGFCGNFALEFVALSRPRTWRYIERVLLRTMMMMEMILKHNRVAS